MRRSKGDSALLEGPHLVSEALDAGLEPRNILATADFLASSAGRGLSHRLPYPALEVEPGLLAEGADSDSPRGILATVDLPRGGTETLPVVERGVYLYAEGLQDPGNLGALARVAEGGGAAALVLGAGSVHPNHPRALRASAGSLLRLPVARDASPDSLEEHLRAVRPKWAALVPKGGQDLYTMSLQGSLQGCLLVALGAEGPGLSAALCQRSQMRVTIPLAAPVESLNVTVAAALVLFEIRRQRPAVDRNGLIDK